MAVHVNKHPIPTAQITVFVFHDNHPLNKAPDLPAETPGTGDGQTDMSGFTVKLEDAGGRYGISAGEAFQDAFGNPLGTTYDDAGNVIGLGSGFIVTGPDGEANFEGLAPGKYGVIVIPPNAVETPPIQATGSARTGSRPTPSRAPSSSTPGSRPTSPAFFAEFGPPGWHAFFGFTKKVANIPPPPPGTTRWRPSAAQVVNNHLSRPPETAFYNGAAFPATTPWVALNANGGTGRGHLGAAPPTTATLKSPTCRPATTSWRSSTTT